MAIDDVACRVEAVLFTTGRFISVEELASLCEIGSVGLIRDALLFLELEYVQRHGALCLLHEGEMWRLALRKEYLFLTEKLLTDTELDKATQETLAVVAYKNPALQSEIIHIRGNGAYDHIKTLLETGFIVSEKHGRTRLLRVTQKFYDYFDVVADQLHEKMHKTQEQRTLNLVGETNDLH